MTILGWFEADKAVLLKCHHVQDVKCVVSEQTHLQRKKAIVKMTKTKNNQAEYFWHIQCFVQMDKFFEDKHFNSKSSFLF